MPGMFGTVDVSHQVAEALANEFASDWGACTTVPLQNGLLGAHAFGTSQAIHRLSETLHFAVDGEASLYRAASSNGATDAIFALRAGELELSDAVRGNIVVADTLNRLWYLACDWTGTFPLYYAQDNGGLLFASRLRPLARVLGRSPDPAGVIGFLRSNYQVAGRTYFQGISRLLPGQILRYDVALGRLTIREASRAWSEEDETEVSSRSCHEVAALAWEALSDAVAESLVDAERCALMMSAGWDSRTLLAVLLSHLDPTALTAYTYGDPQSREIHLATRIAKSGGVRFRLEPLNERMFDLDALNEGFTRTETIAFPHWHLAGRLLDEQGASCVIAGVYGEVLGGHYGPATLLRGGAKVRSVATSILGLSLRAPRMRSTAEGASVAHRFQMVPPYGIPWYGSDALRDYLCVAVDAINDDTVQAFDRLKGRGITSAERLIEAFISEHRGSQYINAQMLSIRARLNVALPYCSRKMLALASRIPLPTKIHNAVNRVVLQSHAPQLLRFPCSATLVSARAPIWLQEVSRLTRRSSERLRWKLHRYTAGRVNRPRCGWVNFDFLRQSRALLELNSDLRMPLWNRRRIERRIRGLAAGTETASPQAIAEALLKAYTVDLMLRTPSASSPVGAGNFSGDAAPWTLVS